MTPHIDLIRSWGCTRVARESKSPPARSFVTCRVASISSPEIPKLCRSFARLSRYLQGPAKPRRQEIQTNVHRQNGQRGNMVDNRTRTTSELYRFEPLGAREARVGAHGGEVVQHGGLRIRRGTLAVQRQGEGNLGGSSTSSIRMEQTNAEAQR